MPPYERQYEIKEPKESLHWINFSTKKMLKLFEELLPMLAQIRDRLERFQPVQAPRYAKPDDLGSKQEEIPF